MSCGSKYEDRNQKERKRRFNGKLGVTHSTRERQREREHRKTQFQNTLTQCLYICVCSMHTFYTSPYKDWQKYYRTSMLFKSAYTNPKIYSSRNIFLRVIASSRFSVQNRRIRSVPTDSVLGLTDRSQTDSVLGFFSRSGRCWACISTILVI